MARRKQNPINDIIDTVGDWLGGDGGSQQRSLIRGDKKSQQRATPRTSADARERLPINQTRFDKDGYPIYPEPQLIRNMPLQKAGYDDAFNKRGQVASTQNLGIASGAAEKFIGDIDTVYINPAYMREYIDQPGTADRKETKALAKKGLTDNLPSFADANSKYFGKKFQVLKYPKRTNSNVFEGKYSNPMKTLQLDIFTTNTPEYFSARAPKSHFASPRGKSRGVDREQAYGPHSKWIQFNEYYNDFRRYGDNVRAVLQHEFGHVLGRPHSDRHYTNENPDKNTIMSYDSATRIPYSSQMLPSDINYWKGVQQDVERKRDVAKRGKSAYKGVARKRK